MRSIAETVEIIVRNVVFRRAVISAGVSAELSERLHAGGTLVAHLNKVVIAVGYYGYAHLDA